MYKTPTGIRLHSRLEDRRRWFDNEWFYKWHFIGENSFVSIDLFDGREAHYGGIAFSGTARDVFWDAVVRGVRREITEQFAWVDSEVRNYNRGTALKAVDECAGLLASFVRAIRNRAVKKDRILRGNGTNFPPENDAGRWCGASDQEIWNQGEAIKAALPSLALEPIGLDQIQNRPRSGRMLIYWNRNQGWLGPLGLLLAVAGVVLPFVL